jgi:hypothetical protein
MWTAAAGGVKLRARPLIVITGLCPGDLDPKGSTLPVEITGSSATMTSVVTAGSGFEPSVLEMTVGLRSRQTRKNE